MASPPPPSDKIPPDAITPADSSHDIPPEGHPLGDLAGYDSQGTDLMPLPEGALDDLPAPASSVAASSWLGREDLARDESDVIRGLTQQPPPPGSSNIFDTGPGGSSRFFTPAGGTEHLTGEQPRPSNDVLYNDLAQPDEPSSVVFSGDDLFERPDVRNALRPPADPDAGRLPGGSSGGNLSFNATDAGDQGSNLFADPTAADLNLEDESGAVPLGNDPHSDADLARSGPGSSIFAGGVPAQGSALDVDHIPIMASADDARFEDLPFDAPPPSGTGADIFGNPGKALRPSGLGAVAFDLPPQDPDATERSGGTVDLDLPPSPPSGVGQSSQRSRGMLREDVAALDPSLLAEMGAAVASDRATMRKRPAEVTGRAPVPETAPARRGGRLAYATGGLVAGAALTVGVGYLSTLLEPARPVPTDRGDRPYIAQSGQGANPTPPQPEATPGANEAALKEAEETRKRLTNDLAAATRRADQYKAELEKTKAPDPELATTQKKLLDALAAADVAKKEAATNAGKLEGTTKALAEATARRMTAEEAVAGVVAAMKENKLAGDGDDPAAALAKVPTALKAATGADAQKAAAMLDELTKARKEAEAARTAADAARAELSTAQAKANDQLRAVAAEAAAKTAQELEAAHAREHALQKQLAEARQVADAERAKLEAMFSRQLADARTGAAVPLTSTELQARDAAASELGRGMTAFFAGRTPDALGALDAAAAHNPADARAWYFLGLAKRRAGDFVGAEAAFRQGADQERKGRSARRQVDEALLNVQGDERRVLRAYRP